MRNPETRQPCGLAPYVYQKSHESAEFLSEQKKGCVKQLKKKPEHEGERSILLRNSKEVHILWL